MIKKGRRSIVQRVISDAFKYKKLKISSEDGKDGYAIIIVIIAHLLLY